jgi:hypothetical protein
MGRLKRKWIGVAIVGALPGLAVAQILTVQDTTQSPATQAEIGGTAAIDIITLQAVGPGAPLRYGNVVPGSERVQLDSETLRSTVDYMMDYGTGVVYLKRPQRAGQMLTVSYRYKATTDPKSIQPMAGLGALKYTVAPGSLSMIMGLGLAERSADGSVMQGNVFGWQNSFKFGQGGGLTGLYIFGDRQKTQNQAGLDMSMGVAPGQAPTDDGKSQFMLQNLSASMGKTKISVDYQDISQNFTNFGAVANAGYDDAAVKRLTAEKGLTRMGYSVSDLGGMSTSFKNVSDGKGSISWRSFGFNQGGLKVNWNTQKVDAAFARFTDIAEADRDQLTKEAGMSRNNLGAQFASKVGNLSWDSKEIKDDGTGQQIQRNQFSLDNAKLKVNFGSQSVSDSFARMPSLLGDEQVLYGKEAGLKRQWMNLQTTLFGSSVPINFSQSLVSSAAGSFKSIDLSAKGKSWSLTHTERSADAGFTRLDALQETASNNEIAGSINAIGSMYKTAPNAAAERGWFLMSSGIDRSYTKIGAEPFKNWTFSADRLNLQGATDGGHIDTVSLANKNINFNYRRQDLGAQFSELTRLMSFEQAQLGAISGLDKTDMSLNATFGAKTLNMSQMTANTPTGDAERRALAYHDKKIDVQVNQRNVSNGFTNVNQLVDPEKDLLATMTGFNQTEAKVHWQIGANMDIQAYLSDARNPQTDEVRKMKNLVMNWSDKYTKFNYTSLEQHNADPVASLFANNVEQLSLTRSFGKYGILSLMDERVKFDGVNGTTPDWHKTFMAYEAKVNARTTVRTEQTRTNFENGDKENIDTNSVSTELTKKVGVTLSNTSIDRGGDDRDETHRNYGFWFDLGNGLRMSYGYVRNMAGQTGGNYTSALAIGQNAGVIDPTQTNTVQQGAVGNFMVGGGYGVNTWDDQFGRTQSFSNVNISTAKPFRFLNFSNVKFNLGLDTAADNHTWLKENRVVGASGNIGKNTLGFEYKSQVDPSGYRGIDRTFVFATDPSDKNWLHASIKYKVRTMPWDEIIAIRDFNISAKPFKNVEVSHQMVTNPEVFQGDAFLGSVVQASRTNKWRLDYKQGPNFSFGGAFDELIDEVNHKMTRTAGLNLKFFEAKGSPISLYYGLEQADNTSLNQIVQRYSFRFDERPGANQQFSLFLGNVSYEHNILAGQLRNNFAARLDYQLRF